MKYIATYDEIIERGNRAISLLPRLKAPHKAKSRQVILDYILALNRELERAETAPEAPPIDTMEFYEEMRYQALPEAKKGA